MPAEVTDYFERTIMPMIRDRHSEVLPEMSIMVLGSVGLGIDDESSDLEAAVYLDDPVWREHGGQLQLSLNDCVLETCPWKKEGSVISVYPLSWLLDGHAKEFLAGANNLPWEEVSFETLFTVQENLILYDPQRSLGRLRAATAPSQRPGHLWKRSLLLELKKLIWEDFGELKLCVRRSRLPEAHILLGRVLEGLFHVGFLVFRQYHPWRTHLRWAFGRLPTPASSLGPDIDLVVNSADWHKKIETIEAVIAAYKDHIAGNAILPEIDIRSSELGDELAWAERLKAWETPNWRDWITRCTRKAVENGYPSRQFWIWSLWGWVNEEPNKRVDNDKE